MKLQTGEKQNLKNKRLLNFKIVPCKGNYKKHNGRRPYNIAKEKTPFYSLKRQQLETIRYLRGVIKYCICECCQVYFIFDQCCGNAL